MRKKQVVNTLETEEIKETKAEEGNVVIMLIYIYRKPKLFRGNIL